MSKTCYIYDDIYSETLASFEAFLNTVEDGEDVELVIMSYGGSVFDGIAIADRIIESNHKFTARILGCAMSAAGMIACACDKIIMSELDSIMLHSARNYLGEVDEGAKIANAAMLKIINRRMAYTEKDLMKDRFFNAEEALKVGLIDEVVKVSPEAAKVAARWAASFRYIGGNMEEEQKKETTLEEEQKKETSEEKAEESQDVLEGILAAIEDLQMRVATLEEKSNTESAECEDDEEKKDDIVAASMKRIFANISKVCKPTAKAEISTPEANKARLDAMYDFTKFKEV